MFTIRVNANIYSIVLMPHKWESQPNCGKILGRPIVYLVVLGETGLLFPLDFKYYIYFQGCFVKWSQKWSFCFQYFSWADLVRVCPLIPKGQISKNTCFFPSSSVFVLNFSSSLPPFPSSIFVCSLTVLLLSCLDGGRDGQPGFQENKDEGASDCRLPGLCQRKQGRTGECVTTRMCTNTQYLILFMAQIKGKSLGTPAVLFANHFA